ncbi:Predicted nucleic acid-binding protein, contains Zn-ribbon domain (includes truncated derivatives) [Actinobaculum suis]|uniref:DciA family protein n=1 Tax=Actinobaculum suis TaxID=1657 RepID=A0A0K9ESM5_9ACTO|nr:DciA family protein [Actinobaculum suis]KMY23183.1 protein in RecF-GyrB intergenic region [Actinobaculum suis]MDY5152686.1 DciA family protein [Actinobaculum suis]SDE09954.1 Predicted nucleic acid-binding protein, contains Zn-ribbon domain (includes truncated derivatives) [Actinobaculum suis]
MTTNRKVEAAKIKAAQENGDILALRALDRVREDAFRRGKIRTRRPSAGYAAQKLADELNDAKPLGAEVFTPSPGVDAGSGARPSWRDPKPLRVILERTILDRGWGTRLNVASVERRWPQIVGENVARNAWVESFDEDTGTLTIRTSSTSWATQMRALLATLASRLDAELGPEIVKNIEVRGPQQRNWRHGRYSVPGRGPRDTYG